MQRRRDGVHMRQHRRVIGVLLEHHEDVHTPSWILNCPAFTAPTIAGVREFQRRAHASAFLSKPCWPTMFLIKPPGRGSGHIAARVTRSALVTRSPFHVGVKKHIACPL